MVAPQYKYLFGPVASRRLGVSLGIDLVRHKTCSLNCVYCECGASTNLTIDRKEYVPTDDVIGELTAYLKSSPKLDVLTFSGSGEPTLHSGFGNIVEQIKLHYPQYKLVLLTNATMFAHPDIKSATKKMDIIIPSLDAVSEAAFRKVARPHSSLTPGTIIDGLAAIKAESSVEMWLEIFIVPGVNDTPEELALLKQAVDKIHPDRVQLNSLDRPPAAEWVIPESQERLIEIAEYFGNGTEIIAKHSSARQINQSDTRLEDAIIQLIKRRPCTIPDLVTTLGHSQHDVENQLSLLMRHHRIEKDQLDRGIFYRIVEDFDGQQSNHNKCA